MDHVVDSHFERERVGALLEETSLQESKVVLASAMNVGRLSGPRLKVASEGDSVPPGSWRHPWGIQA